MESFLKLFMKNNNKFINSILKGDTLKTLKKIPDNFVDIGVTSPPYNKKEKNKGWLVKNVKYSDFIDKMPEKQYQKNQVGVLNELFRITKKGGSFFYNHKIRWEKGKMIHPMEWLLKTEWNIRQEIVWERKIAANIRGWRFWQTEERIYWLYKPENNLIGKELKSKHALLTSVWKIFPERDNEHPAPFPIEIPVRCIYSLLDNSKNNIVIDPYSGSGTTLLAAKELGSNFIGIDLSQEYISKSKKRLVSPSKKDLEKIKNELSKHIVKKTFKQRKENGEYTGKFKK